MGPHGSLHLSRTAGLVGAAVGLAAAGTAVGVAVTRTATSRVRAGQLAGRRGEDGRPVEDVPVNQLRREDPLGSGRRSADRTMAVRAEDGVALWVEEVGPTDAPLTVVFVHGYALSMASWTFQRRDLGEQLATANGHRPTARLVFYDQRGHGASGRGAAERSTIDQLAADLESVLTARVPRGPVVLVGHSMGGMTVLALARRRPELFGTRIAGVALVSTSSGNLGELDFGLPALLTRVRATVLPVAVWAMRRRPGLVERTRRLAKDVVSAVTWSMSFSSTGVDPALGRYVDAMIAGTPVDVVAEFYPAIAGLDVSGAIEPLRRVPTVVLTGDADKLIPKAHSERIRERLEEIGGGPVEYVAVPDAGHLVPLEHPSQVTDVLASLVRRVVARQRPTG
ncbi:alpha/beta fold hydrolase [Modestobacter sp. VKM Ac-2984]|uniref:alpha/beta fold hydrolase n=1 Tax=Modestobacter sp. VKM Ac-2984 TaxID=3004138 RepID=UPI0022AA17F1|nr:alpha/beta hydrolase [Modestobacter sp. VKM Ac-2984]MCZ2816992.1 alpha/beta hydrolase [Modestobacter sp. VKM Ac-2984]